MRQRQEGEGRQRHRRRTGPHALPLHRRGPGRPGLHRRLRRDLAARPGRQPASGLPKHVATVKRPDGGKLQLTYDGHPLYRYAGDRSKADANGEGVGGQWFVVKAGGAASSVDRPPGPASRHEQLRLLASSAARGDIDALEVARRIAPAGDDH